MFNEVDMWKEFKENIPNFLDTSLRSNSLLEQMNTTQDKSDYLWYTFRYLMYLRFLSSFHNKIESEW